MQTFTIGVLQNEVAIGGQLDANLPVRTIERQRLARTRKNLREGKRRSLAETGRP